MMIIILYNNHLKIYNNKHKYPKLSKIDWTNTDKLCPKEAVLASMIMLKKSEFNHFDDLRYYSCSNIFKYVPQQTPLM